MTNQSATKSLIKRRVCPWPDFAGNPIHEGDLIQHPVSGQLGLVKYLVDGQYDADHWRVDYGDGVLSRLGLQIGDKGQAVVCNELTAASFEFLIHQLPRGTSISMDHSKLLLIMPSTRLNTQQEPV